MTEDINQIFQDFISDNSESNLIDFDPLLKQHPQLQDQLQKKISAYQKIVGSLILNTQPEVTDPRINKTIGDCKIIRILGQGGMGIVYLARQEKLNRDVVVKVLRPFAADNSALKERFKRESRIVGKLNHKNIIPIYDIGEEDGSLYIIMKYIKGISLNTLIDNLAKHDRNLLCMQDLQTIIGSSVIQNTSQSGLSSNKPIIEFCCQLTIKVADAVQYAHDNGVVHRDIKPSNILIEPDGNPVLLDFGLSHDEVETNLTISGEFLGTPIYSAPECFEKSEIKNPKLLDVYSLGVTFYELLTFKLPYEGKSIYEILANLKNREPIRPKIHWNQIPRDIEIVLLKSISRITEQRYQTVTFFKDDIFRFSHFLPIEAKAPSLVQNLYYIFKRKKVFLAITTIVIFLIVLSSGLIVQNRKMQTKSVQEQVDALINKSNLTSSQENYEYAIWLLNKAKKIDPKNTKIISSMAQNRISHKRDYPIALEELNYLISVDSKNTGYLDKKAYLLYLMGQWQESIDIERQIIEMEPQNAYHYQHIIGALYQLERWKDILLYAEKGYSIDPQNLFIIGFMADACVKSGDYASAEKYYNKIFTDKFTRKDGLEFFIMTASNFYLNKKFDSGQAINVLEKGSELIPESQTIKHSLNLIKEAYRPESAITNENSKSPVDFLRKKKQGYDFIIAGKYDEAIEVLISLLSTHADDPDLYRGIGYSLGRLNKSESALFYLEEAYKLKPDSELKKLVDAIKAHLQSYESR